MSPGEGTTPLLELPLTGRRVQLKLNFLKPSVSFKDRDTSMLLSWRLHHRRPRALTGSGLKHA